MPTRYLSAESQHELDNLVAWKQLFNPLVIEGHRLYFQANLYACLQLIVCQKPIVSYKE